MHESAEERINKIKELVRKERKLREEVASVRREREILRAEGGIPSSSTRPSWLNSMPKEFWYPSHLMAKLVAESSIGEDQAYTYPDLQDWAERGTTWDAVINVGVIICVVVTTLQIFFILL
jgi:hypothetical protein